MRTSSQRLAAVRKREAMLLASVNCSNLCLNLGSYLPEGRKSIIIVLSILWESTVFYTNSTCPPVCVNMNRLWGNEFGRLGCICTLNITVSEIEFVSLLCNNLDVKSQKITWVPLSWWGPPLSQRSGRGGAVGCCPPAAAGPWPGDRGNSREGNINWSKAKHCLYGWVNEDSKLWTIVALI